MQNDDRPDWDQYFLGVAKAVAARADCRRRKVGAVIVCSSNRIWATGYNGTPENKQTGCLSGACSRGLLTHKELPAYSDYSNCISVHAEENALQQFSRSEFDRTIQFRMYVTEPPCRRCVVQIYDQGLFAIWR